MSPERPARAGRPNVPDEKSGVASGIATTSGEVGSALGVAVVAAILQNRLLANVEAALARTDLPDRAKESILSGLSAGRFGGGTSAAPPASGLGSAAAQVEDLVQDAFAGAVASGLLVVAAAALLGVVLALLFSERSDAGGVPASGKTTHPAETSGTPRTPAPYLRKARPLRRTPGLRGRVSTTTRPRSFASPRTRPARPPVGDVLSGFSDGLQTSEIHLPRRLRRPPDVYRRRR